MCSGDGGGTAGSTKPDRHSSISPAAQSSPLVRGRQEQTVAGRARPPARPPHPLEERRDGRRRVDLDHAVEVADVDAQLERAGGHDHAVPPLGEGAFGLMPLVEDQRAVRDERRDAPRPKVGGQSLDPRTVWVIKSNVQSCLNLHFIRIHVIDR